MPIFAVLPQNDISRNNMPGAVEREFPAHLQLENHVWLVASKGTAVDVSNKLGVTVKDESTPGPTGTAIVFEVGSYYGRASTNVWAWVKANWEAASG